MSHQLQIAGYRILARVGRGAASELYAVQDPKTKQVWALKHVIKENEKDQRFIDQVQTEYLVGSKLDHPNVRGVCRFIKHRKGFKVRAVTLIMELVDATTLDQRLPQTHAEAVRIFLQVARGLVHMHSRGFIHADIKPNNILVTEQEKVKIIDLGQGCATGTVKKRIQGTPGYMAPEQAHRQAITEKTDIYNLGATMYWVLVGEVIPTALPPKDDSDSLYTGALDPDHVKPPVPPQEKDASIHPLLSRQILDCVRLHPDDRPESMAVVANRLELIGELLENPSQPPPPIVGDEDTTF
ncbi:MAG: serine/threonine protein kinase [Planctomycetes bacterium]|nr:serine/threonine protein kinase [Planctomycetota bacterium]